MLIQLVFFTLMLLGVAALTIDLGIVHLTQTQMQASVDAAALEGLRGRDSVNASLPQECVGLTPEDARRCAAHYIARQSADIVGTLAEAEITLNPSANPAALADPDLNALAQPVRLMDYGTDATVPGTFVPDLQGNYVAQQQKEYGDLVSGCFDPQQPPTEESALSATPYHRADFNASCASKGSFLARLRRTAISRFGSDLPNHDIDQDPGVSCTGAPLPFLFGLASPIRGSNPTVYSPRVDGVTVRATAIANSAPVTQVGPPVTVTLPGTPPPPPLVLPGWGPVTIRSDEWTTIDTGANPAPVTFCNTGGSLTTYDAVHLVCTTNQIGFSLSSPAAQSGAMKVGDPITPTGLPVRVATCGAPPAQLDACGNPVEPPTPPASAPRPTTGYIPIYSSTTLKVIGFGFANVCQVPFSNPVQITVTPINNHIACANASAVGHQPSTLPATTSLLAPVIAR